jgi:uncharacterized membrane protein YdfJ with MMPL/SSD domain
VGKALYALGAFCARRSLVMIGIWVAILVLIGLTVAKFGTETSNDLTLPGTGSQEVKDLLEERFPPQQNGTNPIVFAVETGKLTDQANKKAINASIKAMAKAPHVYSVTNPISSDGQTAGLLSKDGQTAFAPVLLDIGSGELDEEISEEIFATADPARDAGIDVQAAGSIGTELSDQPTESSEVVGILAAMLILTLVLGSVVAMGLPIVAAIVGLGAALSLVGLAGHLVSMPDTGATLATMIGLGVGIDYALFLITRHQDQIRGGMPMDESIARSVATSGSAIVFAGSTVVIALVSLRVAGIPLLSTLGLASAIAVVTAVLAAISLLPALLGLLGRRIEWLSLPKFMRKQKPTGGMWGSWAGFVSRHPIWVTIVALAFLAPLIAPAPALEFGQEDIGATSPSTTERKAYDLITAGFGIGYNGPLQVASKLDPVATPSNEYTNKYNKATSLQKQLKKDQKQLPKEQKQLEKEQKQLEKQQSQLERQQATLERQGAALQASATQLEAQETQLEAEKSRLEAKKARLEARRAKLRSEAEAIVAEGRPLVRQLARLEARARVLERRIERLVDRPILQARLEARLDEVHQQEQQIRDDLAPLRLELERLAKQAEKLLTQAEKLNEQSQQLQAEGAQLQTQAAQLQRQQAQLEREANQLTRQGNQLKAQGDALQEQADELKAEQQQAKQQQKQAEKLQSQLTDMVTAAGGDPRGTDPRVVDLQSALSGTPGVLTLTPPQINKAGDVVLLSAVPTTGPATDETTALLAVVRGDVLPKVEADGGIESYVGGYTASYVDLADLISERLLLVIATVILLGFLLLMVAFRSLLVPLQAAVTNILSALAAFGILTACFQWGWGISLVGIDTASDTVPIASYVPLMMFAVLFGLSMDYEVFLVSHIQTHHAAGEPARQAAASGLRSSGRITTAAALIMGSVFASFILNGDPTIKQFGVGLSSAVLLAGLLVITLAPAVIVLMGEAAWWLPRWLNRILPHINVEGEPERPPPTAGAHVAPQDGGDDASPTGLGEPDPGPARATQ